VQNKEKIMTDREVEHLELGHAAVEADVWRVARVIAERYLTGGATLSWQMLRDIEEETLCDISLLGRWPLESLVHFIGHAEVPPNEDVVDAESARHLTGLPAFIQNLFQQQRAEASS
jgi:hypothetical protein